jgi:hypothetical protein
LDLVWVEAILFSLQDLLYDLLLQLIAEFRLVLLFISFVAHHVLEVRVLSLRCQRGLF